MTKNSLDLTNQLTLFTGLPAAKDGKSDRFTNITAIYSHLPKRLTRQPRARSQELVIERDYWANDTNRIHLTIKPTVMTKTTSGKVEQTIRFPMLMEDRVEEAIAYIASQGSVSALPDEVNVGVRFTLSRIKAIIAKLFGKSYSLDQIKASLELLANSPLNLTIYDAGDKIGSITGTRISELMIVDRATYEKNSSAECACRLHPLFVQEIMAGSFSAHDLAWQGELTSDLAQDLFKFFAWRYHYANSTNSYHVKARRLLENTSRGFNTSNPSKSWTELDTALKCLKKHNVISDFSYKDELDRATRGRPRLIDRTITIKATERFIALQRFKHFADRETGHDRLVDPLANGLP